MRERWLTCAALVTLALATAVAAPSAAGRVAQPVPRSITLEWVGDMALSTERGLPPGGLAAALAPVRGSLRSADVTLGNLEGTLSVGGQSKCAQLGTGSCYAFQAPSNTAFALPDHHFRISPNGVIRAPA